MTVRIILAIICLLLCLTGCVPAPITQVEPTTEPPETIDVLTEPIPVTRNLSWEAQFVRTNSFAEGEVYPQVSVIADRSQLEEYHIQNRQTMDLDHGENSFSEVCEAYTEEFFTEKYLLFILVEEGSGSVRHQVQAVKQVDENLQVQIEAIVPEVGTCDMAQWHIILELDKTPVLPDAQQVMVYMYERLIWDGSPVELPVPPELQPEMLTQPPDGRLLYPDGEIQLAKGGFGWTYQNEDGSETTICADQALRFPTTLPLVPVTGFCKLDFTAAPKELTITSWLADVDGVEGDPVPLEGQIGFTPLYGDRIYEITATWDNGTVQYYVRLELVSFISYGMGKCIQLQDEAELEALLQNLTYHKGKVCKCRPQYYLITEDGTRYGVHLSEGYVRCSLGQADLTREQLAQIQAYCQEEES